MGEILTIDEEGLHTRRFMTLTSLLPVFLNISILPGLIPYGQYYVMQARWLWVELAKEHAVAMIDYTCTGFRHCRPWLCRSPEPGL